MNLYLFFIRMCLITISTNDKKNYNFFQKNINKNIYNM